MSPCHLHFWDILHSGVIVSKHYELQAPRLLSINLVSGISVDSRQLLSTKEQLLDEANGIGGTADGVSDRTRIREDFVVISSLFHTYQIRLSVVGEKVDQRTGSVLSPKK